MPLDSHFLILASLMSGAHPSFTSGRINPSWRIAIIYSVWHGECTDALRDSAITELTKQGIARESILTVAAPGSFEIPLLCKTIIDGGKADGIIAFGVIVQGETHHAEMIAEQSARALMDMQLTSGVPIINEIMFVDDIEHARRRAIGTDGKGALAAQTVLKTLANLAKLR